VRYTEKSIKDSSKIEEQEKDLENLRLEMQQYFRNRDKLIEAKKLVQARDEEVSEMCEMLRACNEQAEAKALEYSMLLERNSELEETINIVTGSIRRHEEARTSLSPASPAIRGRS